MTTGTIPTSSCPSVFDVGLPSLDYLQVQDPEDAHRAIATPTGADRPRRARSRGAHLRPGPHGAARPAVRRCVARPAQKPKASPQGRCGIGSPV